MYEEINAKTLQTLGNRALSDKFYEQTKEYFAMIADLADGNPYTPFESKLKYAFERGISPEQIKLNLNNVLAKNPGREEFIQKSLQKTVEFGQKQNRVQHQYTYSIPDKW